MQPDLNLRRKRLIIIIITKDVCHNPWRAQTALIHYYYYYYYLLSRRTPHVKQRSLLLQNLLSSDQIFGSKPSSGSINNIIIIIIIIEIERSLTPDIFVSQKRDVSTSC